MAKIPNGEVARAGLACRALIEYGHRITKDGLPLPTQIKLMRLEKLLRERELELRDVREAALKRYGWKGKPDKDDGRYPAFREEEIKMALASSDIPDELTVRQDELKVRNAEDELEAVRCPMTVYLGPLLRVDEAPARSKQTEETAGPEAPTNRVTRKPPAARSGKARGKKPVGANGRRSVEA